MFSFTKTFSESEKAIQFKTKAKLKIAFHLQTLANADDERDGYAVHF